MTRHVIGKDAENYQIIVDNIEAAPTFDKVMKCYKDYDRERGFRRGSEMDFHKMFLDWKLRINHKMKEELIRTH